MKNLITICLMFCVVASLGFVSGCIEMTGNKGVDTGIVGGGVGALAGQLIGRNTKSTLIGAGIGALGGYIIGEGQKTKEEMAELRAQQNIEMVVIQNTNGSTSTVILRKDGYGGYIGPRGERYNSMPTQEQLRQVYGM
ncbi:MAG: YMGG-like glycine zipper-containing protein [Nanoarchaeota archaeon]